jgi:uncharacterized membrane protein YgcG
MKPAVKILLAVAILALSCSMVTADTGTYQILDYRVKLTPKSNGTVEIEYFQRWLVTGGSIPWVTIGLPNSDFSILPNSKKGNVSLVYAANSGNWSGVHIDLDRAYKASEIFEVGFSLIENQLFYADGDNYKLVFWPGWYDRAKTNSLRIEVFLFAKTETVKADPAPGRIEDQSLIWERKNLDKGEKFRISVSIPKTLMTGRIVTGTKPRTPPGTSFFPTYIFLIFFFIVLIVIIINAVRYRFRGSYGSGPLIYHGGGRGSGGKGGGILSGGGGGGFGGRSFSCVCVCACAGCACACACAGGSAAGCDRKLSQLCVLCRKCKTRYSCKVWNGITGRA